MNNSAIREYLLPSPLSQEQKVGIFAPSAPGLHRFHERFSRGISMLEEVLERPVVVPIGAETPGGRLAGTPEQRATCFNTLMSDPSIGAIFTTYGGYNCNEILNFIDWDIARSNPKIVVGYSDTTALLLALTEKANLTTYYGPAVLPQMGEVGGAHQYTLDELHQTIVHGKPRVVPMLNHWYDQTADWEKGDIPRVQIEDQGAFCASNGTARGQLFGGNTDTINYLVGTEYLRPPLHDTILFLEMVDSAAVWGAFRRSIVHLRDAGFLQNVKGIVVGRSPQTGSCKDQAQIFSEVLPDPKIPIILNAPFGHFDPITTLPIGAVAQIKSSSDDCSIEILGKSLA